MNCLSRTRRRLAVLPLSMALLVVGCGGGDDSTPTPTPTPTPIPKRTVLITWGNSGMLWAGSLSTSCDEIPLLKNAFQTLAQKQTGIRVLYAGDSACDPRTSANYCSLVSDPARLAPFFAMIDSIGTIDFKAYSSVDPYAYDVVILDCCRTSLTSIKTSIANYIDTVAHGGMFVVGSRSCYRSGTPSSELAQTVVQSYGTTFLAEDPTGRGCHDIAAEKRTGLLAGVTKLDFYRVVPQTLVAPAKSVYEDATARPLMSYYERDVTR
jgi:hypothetical protein